MGTLESQSPAVTVLDRIAKLSAHNSDKKFHSLMHHINVDSLRACFHELDGRKAVGIDGVTKADYGEDLEANLEDLIARMKRMAYRPGPVREVLIPKEGKPGATRPLGISNFEDKLVQRCMQKLLEAIYDPIFIDRSYGFRRGRSCHDAIDAVMKHLYTSRVSIVIDVDLANFFGTIDHKFLTEMLKEKILDTRFLRYIQRMFKAGVIVNGEKQVSVEGVPQGSCCSPVLANIFAHFVIDVWFNEAVKSHCKGNVEMFRYADDMVILCENSVDANRIKEALGKRLAKYKLTLNEDKTKMVRFSRREFAKDVKQETFDFLGFTFYIGRSRKGRPIAKLKTSSKRFRSKLRQLTVWMKENRHKYRLQEIWTRVCAAVRGDINYYGVSFNMEALQKFIYEVSRIVFKWLNRRSQRKSFDWKKFNLFMSNNPLPVAKIHHRLF